MSHAAGDSKPPRDRYLLDVLRRRDDVLWAGQRSEAEPPTVIAQDVAAIQATLPDFAGDGWIWVECPWSWSDVRTVSMELTRLGGGHIRSLKVGPRDDGTFGILLALAGPSQEIEEYLEGVEPGLVQLVSGEDAGPAVTPSLPAFW